MTEEQYKAAVEKAAKALYANGFGVTVHDAEAYFSLHPAIRTLYETAAQAALTAVGYFAAIGVVEAARRFMQTAGPFVKEVGRDVDLLLLQALETALAEVPA